MSVGQEKVIVLDFGSQYTQLTARQIRDNKVFCEILPSHKSVSDIKQKQAKGIILTGIKAQEAGAWQELGLPMLASADGKIAPETLKEFLFETCACSGQWTMASFLATSVAEIKAQVGDKQVLCALSGGVDSSVAALMVHKAVGDKLTCVFVDHGMLRKGEAAAVMQTFQEEFQMKIIHVDASERFLGKLRGITDPEQKRKIIGEEFIRVFEEEAKKLGQIDFLVQGTLYPDVVESGACTGAMIKSHHNVGGLPEDMQFELIEPLYWLFKDEVRLLGEEMDMPSDVVWRQPFPGPGLAVRVLGEITPEKLEVVREADAIVREEIKKAGLEREVWQYFAVLPNIKSVGKIMGAKGGERTYAWTVGVRAIHSSDGMTARWVHLPHQLLENISTRICSEVAQVNRVVYDITSKPPSTIEWE